MCLLFFFVVLCCVLSRAYNLNTLHTIIYEDAHKQLRIDAKQTLFGYTTALYRGRDKPRIFIGAPRGADISLPARNPGVVFTCGIKQSCDILSLDTDTGYSTSRGVSYVDSKDDAWIGGTMDVHLETGTMVVCGFRWTTNAGVSMVGVCYVWRLADKTHRVEKLLPLLNPGKTSLHFTRSSVYFYALGEAGFSAQFTHDKEPNLLLGAPGLLNWYGGSVLYTHLNPLSGMRPTVSRQQQSAYALFGYAVTSGRYLGAGSGVLHASGAPKGNGYVGTVTLYSFGPANDSFVRVQCVFAGSQVGEYFGAALATADLNGDGVDDLLVGAPFYAATHFNAGRVHIFYGGADFADAERVHHVTGAGDGGHFGAAVTTIGDLNLDGYADIAIGEPYGDNQHGRVFIYHGGPYGLNEMPAQILTATDINPQLRGFGISISKGVDIDGNGYPDISIGAHLSGHAVVLRTNPIVELDTQLRIVNGTKINIGNTTIMHCYAHSGSPYVPKHVPMRRTLTIDPIYQRVALASPTQMVREFMLKNDCEIFVLTTKEKLYYLSEPVKVSVSYALVAEDARRSNFYVGTNNTDTFCKTCPVLLNVRPFEKDFPFALGCGDDDVCISHLSFDMKFFDLANNTFVVGSTEVIHMHVMIVNSGDSAYLTQLSITLPTSVRFNAIPKKCVEEAQGTLICLVGNPLEAHAHVAVPLNVRDVRVEHGSELTFYANVSTTSNNRNPERQKSVTIRLQNVVDLRVMGKAEPALLFYTYDNATFKQVYEIQKIGHSPAEQVSITIELPTHIVRNNASHAIVKLYSIMGSMRGRSIFCQNHSQVEHVREMLAESAPDLLEMEQMIRQRRAIEGNIVYTNNLNESSATDARLHEYDDADGIPYNDLLVEDALSLDCRNNNSNTRCTKFTCDVGTIASERDIGVIRIKALLDVAAIAEHFKSTHSILLSSYANVNAAFEIDPISNNHANITSTFLDSKEFRLDMWILICATLAGLFLLLIITVFLYNCGFFTRNKKLQLEEEMKQAATEEFQNARLSGEAPMEESDL